MTDEENPLEARMKALEKSLWGDARDRESMKQAAVPRLEALERFIDALRTTLNRWLGTAITVVIGAIITFLMTRILG